MKFLFFIFYLILIGNSTKPSYNYEKIFQDDYSGAKYYIRDNYTEFKTASIEYGHDQLFSNAIVFPELLRYSFLSDIIETSALELFYVEYGPQAADFSIGRFQMKPSFIESIEMELVKNKGLAKQYWELLFDRTLKEKDKRIQRIVRLKNLKWQLRYLHAFISICDKRFLDSNEVSVENKLLLYATAYNSGFYQSRDELIKKADKRLFPYGLKYNGAQYAYCDVSNYYYSENH